MLLNFENILFFFLIELQFNIDSSKSNCIFVIGRSSYTLVISDNAARSNCHRLRSKISKVCKFIDFIYFVVDTARIDVLLGSFLHFRTGYFCLTPGHGLDYIADCRESGFHPHPKKPPLFMDATHILIDDSLHIEVVDLRE